MSAIIIDIHTRNLTPEHNVFLARPGERSRLHADFLEAGRIGPELPYLDLNPSVAIDHQPQLIQKIKRSLKIRAWIQAGKTPDDAPEMDLSKYNENATKSTSQYAGILKGFFERSKKGDFFVVYPQAFSEDVVVFEIIDEPLRFNKFNTSTDYFHKNDYLCGRRVKEIGRFKKREINESIFEITRKPNAIVNLGRSDKEFVYEKALDNFYFDGITHSKIIVRKPDYDLFDDLLLKSFINYVAANYFLMENGKTVSISESLDFDLGDNAPEISSNINSPGHHRLRSIAIVPILFAVLQACAAEVPADQFIEAAANGTIQIRNSDARINDECAADVEAAVINWFQHARLVNEWPAACARARAAANRAQVNTSATVRVEP